MDQWKNVRYTFDPKLYAEFENVIDEEAERFTRSMDRDPVQIQRSLVDRDKAFLCKIINISFDLYPPRKRRRSLTKQGFKKMIETGHT